MNNPKNEISQTLSDEDAYDLINWTDEVESAISLARESLGIASAKRYTKFFMSISHYKKNLRDIIGGGSQEVGSLLPTIATLKIRVDDMMSKAKDDELPTQAFNHLQNLAAKISERNSYLASKYSYHLTNPPSNEDKSINKISASIEMLRGQIASLQNDHNQSRNALQKTRKQAENTDIQLSSYSQRLNDALEDINTKANTVLAELEDKKTKVNELVGNISGEAISGSYNTSAITERKNADSMRNGSVMLMLLITLLLAFSLFESGKPHFDLETAIFRFVLSLALSVPAAYLARESAKHRTQQYSHQRTALDLQAITPYIASLPEAEQHRLKAEIANRLFGTADQAQPSTDPYPLNLQELLMAALSKFDSQKSNNKEK